MNDSNQNNDNNQCGYKSPKNKTLKQKNRLSDSQPEDESQPDAKPRPFGYTLEEKDEIFQMQLEAANAYIVDLRQKLLYIKTQKTKRLMYDLRPGQVYEIDFGIKVGSELQGRHYAVVMAPSLENNQIVQVVPLKTQHSDPNPTSDVLIGQIPGLEGDVSTIAVFNQMQAIDKLRIFRKSIIRKTKHGNQYAEKEPVAILDEEQLKKIKDAIYQTTIEGKLFYTE